MSQNPFVRCPELESNGGRVFLVAKAEGERGSNYLMKFLAGRPHSRLSVPLLQHLTTAKPWDAKEFASKTPAQKAERRRILMADLMATDALIGILAAGIAHHTLPEEVKTPEIIKRLWDAVLPEMEEYESAMINATSRTNEPFHTELPPEVANDSGIIDPWKLANTMLRQSLSHSPLLRNSIESMLSGQEDSVGNLAPVNFYTAGLRIARGGDKVTLGLLKLLMFLFSTVTSCLHAASQRVGKVGKMTTRLETKGTINLDDVDMMVVGEKANATGITIKRAFNRIHKKLRGKPKKHAFAFFNTCPDGIKEVLTRCPGSDIFALTLHKGYDDDGYLWGFGCGDVGAAGAETNCLDHDPHATNGTSHHDEDDDDIISPVEAH